MPSFLKAIALACKLAAILFWVYHAWVVVGLDLSDLRATSEPKYRDAPDDWGTPAFKQRMYLQITQELTLVVLAVLPNRWLVSSPVVFILSLLVSFWPLYPLNLQLAEWSDWIFLLIIVAMFSPLAISLGLSFARRRMGEKIGYV